jgi:hypothetical protein
MKLAIEEKLKILMAIIRSEQQSEELKLAA